MVHFRAERHHYLYGRIYRPLGICNFFVDGTVFVGNAIKLPIDTSAVFEFPNPSLCRGIDYRCESGCLGWNVASLKTVTFNDIGRSVF